MNRTVTQTGKSDSDHNAGGDSTSPSDAPAALAVDCLPKAAARREWMSELGYQSWLRAHTTETAEAGADARSARLPLLFIVLCAVIVNVVVWSDSATEGTLGALLQPWLRALGGGIAVCAGLVVALHAFGRRTQRP